MDKEDSTDLSMPVFIDLTTDFGFKRVFQRKEFMIPFLNDLLSAYNISEVVTDIEYLNTDNVGEVHKDKRIVFDLKCETESGDVFIVEMQKRGQEHFDDRIIYYMDRSVAMQGEVGDDLWKFGIKKVYGIFMMDFNEKLSLKQKNIRHCGWYDYSNKCSFSSKQQFWLINLPQYRKYKSQDCKTKIEKWMYIISNLKNMRTMPFTMEMPVFKGFKTIAEIAKMSRKERESYILEYDAHRTDLAAYDYAIKEGRAEGEKVGIEKGRFEQLAESVKNLMSAGFSFEDVAKMLKISEQQISDVRKLVF